MSDTHLQHGFSVPEGDVLIHAGDVTMSGSFDETEVFLAWFESQPHRHKIFVAGNHDWAFQRDGDITAMMLEEHSGITYLQDSGCEVEGIPFWGSPWQPWFMDWAFNLPRGQKLAEKWAAIPDGTQVLITHSPPHGILDKLPGRDSNHVGCEAMLERIQTLPCLKVHVFGHIHCGYGQALRNGVRFHNSSICDEHYQAVRMPIVVDL